ncbi:hypothetical protein HD554DRAFT_2038378 [Boletus coccyginus]|nr:hypothetical protein HD554DRAFT_2038378 [Boletus coccyginus]
MAPVALIPNGIYQIQNGQYPDSLATYLAPEPGAPILGYPRFSPPEQKQEWKVTNQGDGGNQVTIESVSAPGSFATVAGFFDGAPLFAKAPTVWTVVKVDGGKYYLQSPDGKFVWQLPGGAPYTEVLLCILPLPGARIPLTLIHKSLVHYLKTIQDKYQWLIERGEGKVMIGYM